MSVPVKENIIMICTDIACYVILHLVDPHVLSDTGSRDAASIM